MSLLVVLSTCLRVGLGNAQRQEWRGVGVSQSAPLPPAENFKSRPHGDGKLDHNKFPGMLFDRLDANKPKTN